ncbi:ABC transporter permease [Bacillus sp. CGMCC 1.16607]|uniref:ABC transporter permease n=1 Tax=Bacillus sp. CGMCC 1.16607 TaxID=3351842 RepID=UPI0036318336
MIYNTFHLGWKQTWAKRKRSLFSFIGVTFAVALLIGIYVLKGQMNEALDRQITDLYGKTDMMVGYRYDKKLLSEKQVEEIEDEANVLDSGRTLVNPHQYLEQYQGKSTGLFYFGVDNSQLVKSLYKFNQDLKAGEAVIPANLAETLQVGLGDLAEIPFHGGRTQTWKVAEVLPENNGGAEIIFFHLESLQKAFGLDHQFTMLLLDLPTGVDKYEIASSLKTSVVSDLDVDYLDSLDEAKQNINNMKFLSYGLGVLVLLASLLLVLSNYHISLRERVRELAVLRAIGFSQSKLLKVAVTETMIIHTAGVLIGTVFGCILPIVLRKILSKWLNVEMINGQLHFSGIVFIAILCWLVFSIVALIPAYRSTKILPITAIRLLDWNDHHTKRFPFSGIGFSLIGVVLFTTTSLINVSNGYQVLFQVIGGVVLVLGMFMCTPQIMNICFSCCRYLLEKIFGPDAQISVKQAVEQRRQSAVTVMVIALSITLAFAVLSFIFALKSEMVRNIDQEYVGDLIVKSNRLMRSSIPYEIGKDIEKIKGIEYAFPIGTNHYAGYLEKEGNRRDTSFVMGDLEQLSENGFIPKFSVAIENAIFLPRHEAEKWNLQLGDQIQLTPDSFSGKVGTFIVAGIIEKVPGYETDIKGHEPLLVDWNNPFFREYLTKNNENSVYKVIIKTDGSELSTIKDELSSLERKYPEMRISDKQTALAEVKEQLGQRMVIFWSIISIILFIGMMGMMNTMSAIIHGKRREFAILRAVFITPKRLMKIIALQSFLFVIAAIFIGLFTGLILSYSFVTALDGTMMIPYRELLFVIVMILFFISIVVLPLAKRVSSRSVASELSQTMD